MIDDTVPVVPISDWSEKCAAFLAHWLALRCGDALMPTTEDFLDQMPAWAAPDAYVMDVHPDTAILRFLGTNLVRNYGFDLTGQSAAAKCSDPLQARFLDLMAGIVTQPCGNYYRIAKARL